MQQPPILHGFLSGLGAVLFAGTLLAADSSAETLLLGRVADEQGHAISNAELIVRHFDRNYDAGAGCYWKNDRDVLFHSDADGRFAVQAAVGDQRLSVFADGYAPMHRTHRAYEGQNPGWDFTLVKSARVSCKILDTNGRPQSPRFLLVAQENDSTPPPAPGLSFFWYAMNFEETSNPDGSFDIPHLSPGRYSIMVTSPWLQAKKEGSGLVQIPVSGGQFEVAAGETITNFEIRVRPPEDYAVAGRVHRADGAPMPNVSVTTRRSGGARTDSNGYFRIEGLDSVGSARFSLQFDYKLTLPEVVLNTTNLDVVWPGSGAIEGHVFDAATGSNLVRCAAGVPKVQLGDSNVFYENPSAQFELLPEGRFRLANVPAGAATLIVSNGILGARQFAVDVKVGQTAEVECAMVAPAMLEGYLTHNGNPGRASVVLNGQWVYTDVDGKQVVWFFNHEYSHRYADVELVAGQTVRQDMELGGPCAVEGTVRFPAGGAERCELRLAEIPASEAWDGGRPWPHERVLAIAPVKAADPKYALKNLPPGRFFLIAGVPNSLWFGYQPAWTREIELKAGEPLSLDVDLVAPPVDPAP